VTVEERPVVEKSVQPTTAKGRPDKIAMLANLEKKQTPVKQDSITAKTILTTILKLAVVLVLAYLTILVLKWLSVKKDAPGRESRNAECGLRNRETLRLSPTSTLHLVDVKGKTLLIGCASGQVSLISEFGREGGSEEASSSQPETDGKFAEYLEKYSEDAQKHGPAGRVAGLLRDCTAYLKERSAGGGKQ